MPKLEILRYPHPALRHVSKPLRRVDAEFHDIVRTMFELMYEAKGIGLAANQVGLPYRFFVINPTADPAEKEQETVFINPVLSQHKGTEEADEGCLSLPELYAPVKRPANVVVESYNLAGEEVRTRLEGLLARVVQHENDHIDGVLFIDRLSDTAKMDVRDALVTFESEFAGRRQRGEIPDDEQITRDLIELERLRT